MTFHKAKEESKWKQWKEQEERILRKSGVSEEVIQRLRELDWQDFNAERRFWEHFSSNQEELYTRELEEPSSVVLNIQQLLDSVENEQRFGNEGEYWKESAKMLAGMIHLMRGTPYIYQGEEIGMTNPHYTSIEQYADVESRNYYEILLNEGKTKEEALEILAARSRDNSRTPMQWTDERYCGFSDTKPWIPVSDNFEKINVKKQKQDRDSILEFYKKLIMLRKEKEVIARGNIEFMEVENAGVLAYTRCLDKQKLLVCCNFRDVESQMEFTQEWKSGRKILGNYEENHKNNYKVLTLRPYEIIVLEKGEE